MLLFEDNFMYDGVTDETTLTSVDNVQNVCMCLAQHRRFKTKNSVFIAVASEAPKAIRVAIPRHRGWEGVVYNHQGDKPLGVSVWEFLG